MVILLRKVFYFGGDFMVQKRAKKNKTYTRVQRLKMRRRKILSVTLPSILIIIFIIAGLLLKTKYVSYKCQDLTYAIDYYFTNWEDKDLRINRVQSITLIGKSEDKATVEAFGLSHTEPYQRTTLIGEFTKDQNGSWIMDSVEKKESTP